MRFDVTSQGRYTSCFAGTTIGNSSNAQVIIPHGIGSSIFNPWMDWLLHGWHWQSCCLSLCDLPS